MGNKLPFLSGLQPKRTSKWNRLLGDEGVYAANAYHFRGDYDYDYACLITNPTGDERFSAIGDITGYSGLTYNWPSSQLTIAFGYPVAAPFNGDVIQQIASVEWYETDTTPGDQASKYIGGDLTAGADGGGWFLSWRHPTAEFPDTDNNRFTDPAGAMNGPFLNGLTSHRRCRMNCSNPPSAGAVNSGKRWVRRFSAAPSPITKMHPTSSTHA